MTLMINIVSFSHAPPSSRYINPSHKDPKNKVVDDTKLEPHTTFVDDIVMEEVISLIRQAVKNSVLAELVFISDSDIIKEKISIKKFERFFTHFNKTLGFVTNSRSMEPSYLDYKRAPILNVLKSSEWGLKYSHQVQFLSKILGNIHHLAHILPFGNHLSVPLQLCLAWFI